MKFAALLGMAASFSMAGTWSGKLVDASCKARTEARDTGSQDCPADVKTHLFGIELANAEILILNAVGNEKSAKAVLDARKTDLRAVVTGTLDGRTLKVNTIEIH